MIMKTLTAGVLATSLAFTSLTPATASAEISDGDAVVGLITLLLLGAAIHNNRDDDVRTQPAHPPRVTHPAPRRDWRVLPAQCLQTVTRRNGDRVRLFTQRCLTNNYAQTQRLPQACHVQFRTRDGGHRAGYRAACLRNQGFRTNQR